MALEIEPPALRTVRRDGPGRAVHTDVRLRNEAEPGFVRPNVSGILTPTISNNAFQSPSAGTTGRQGLDRTRALDFDK